MGKKFCVVYGCDAEYNNGLFGRLRAKRLGWFLKEKGDLSGDFCPQHLPVDVKLARDMKRVYGK